MSEELVERLRREMPSGQWTIGSGSISSDGTFKGVCSMPIMRFANPDGPEAADAIEAQAAEIARLREALERLLTMPGDVDLSCNPHQAQVDALNARRKVWNFARAALSGPMP
jgi:hypothetical protein